LFAAILWSFGDNSKPFQEVFAASQSPQLVLTFGHQLRPPNSFLNSCKKNFQQPHHKRGALLEATVGVPWLHIIACKLLPLCSLFLAL